MVGQDKHPIPCACHLPDGWVACTVAGIPTTGITPSFSNVTNAFEAVPTISKTTP